MAVTHEPNDSGQLLPAVDRLGPRLEKKPQQMVADSGYTTRENIEKMAENEEARKQNRRRGRIVEFYRAWIKGKLGLRQFHVRGLKKVQMEMRWARLTYNLQEWIRLSKLRTTAANT